MRETPCIFVAAHGAADEYLTEVTSSLVEKVLGEFPDGEKLAGHMRARIVTRRIAWKDMPSTKAGPLTMVGMIDGEPGGSSKAQFASSIG